MITIGAVDVGAYFLPPLDIKEIDRAVFEANCAMIDSDEEIDDDIQNVNNIVHNFRLQPASFDKASYGAYLKGTIRITSAYLKGLRATA